MNEVKKECDRCPRHCSVNREGGEKGYCGIAGELKVARSALHMWEEPCISGENGSGTVFFSGCNLHCVYCQNVAISGGVMGENITTDRLSELFLELQGQGAHNINLVTPSHYVPEIKEALLRAKQGGLSIPIVYNCGGYESVESLRMLEGLVDIYLTDFKYMDKRLAEKYSHAKDYPAVAMRALAEMVRQLPAPVFEPESGEDGLMLRGVIVRHLVLPGQTEDSKAVVRYLYETYGNQIYVSLMSQYTPMPQVKDYAELNRKVTDAEYDAVVDYAISLGLEQGFIQEGDVASESFIPEFSNQLT